MYPIEALEKDNVVSDWIIKSLLCINFSIKIILDDGKHGF